METGFERILVDIDGNEGFELPVVAPVEGDPTAVRPLVEPPAEPPLEFAAAVFLDRNLGVREALEE